MNKYLTRLANLSYKESRLIIGLMSGTSLDGLDIALCKISGSGLATEVEVLSFETITYSTAFKEDIKTIFAKKEVSLEKLTLLNSKLASLHAELVNTFLADRSIAASQIDCIASHGQTVYHAPKRLHKLSDYPNATLQIGDGDHLAVQTGIITLSDFRQKHVAAGGEGAPLALYGDYLLFSSRRENRVLLNIGGISNFTYLPKDDNGAIESTDAGPGNSIIDALCRKHFNMPFDDGGKIAERGKVIPELLNKMLQHPFFLEEAPKTTGPELFNIAFFEDALGKVNPKDICSEDLVRTATQFTAKSISSTIEKVVRDKPFTVYVSGGGAKNKSLLDALSNELASSKIAGMESLGVSPDAKEAVLFAVLANETVCGSVLNIKAGPNITMGKISLPA